MAKGEIRHPGDALARAIRAEEELERFFELSIDMLGVASFDGYFTRVNPAFERVLGYSVEEVRRESFVSFVHPSDREATVAELERISRGAQTVAFENRYRTSSGGYRWLQWTGISDPDHRVVYAVARDVTDAKQVEAETRALLAGQAALRRVATRVAREGDHTELFELVTEEVGRLLEARSASIVRYEPDGHGLVLGGWGEPGAVRLPSGSVVELESESAAGGVYRTGQALRVERFLGEEGTLASKLREMGFQSAIGAPIYVDGKLWGALIASRDRDRAWPAEAERSLADFGELVAQAIANADARDQLAASRARAVGASDAERRRLERNLHDGAQQRLVALSLTLRLAQTRIESDPGEVRRLIEGANQELTLALAELRELANGLHPALLADRGLGPALAALAGRAPVPVEIAAVPDERLPEQVEVAAYYVVSEALTNVAKYAQASGASVRLERVEGRAVVEVADDGIGGADPAAGSGLRGLADRIGALGGDLSVTSPPGGGTTLRADIPMVDRKA